MIAFLKVPDTRQQMTLSRYRKDSQVEILNMGIFLNSKKFF